MGFDWFGDAGEGPRGDGKTKRKELKNINLTIHFECQKTMEGPRHRDVIECVLQVYCDAPHGVHYACGYGGDPFHLELGHYKEGVEDGQVYDESVRAIFLWDYEMSRKEERLRKIDSPDDVPGEKSGKELPDGRKLGFLRSS